MSRRSRRALASPPAALVALAAVCLALSLYASTLAGVLPTADRDLASPTLRRVHDAVSVAGVAAPSRLDAGLDAGPTGYHLRVTLRTADDRWVVGTRPPSPRVDAASRSVSVRVSPGRVRSGRLRVEVWP